MVWSLKEFLYLISGAISTVIALNHLYWWQTKEYRLDRMLTWVKFDRGWKELSSLKSRRPQFTQRALMIGFVALALFVFVFQAFYISPFWVLGAVLLPLVASLATAMSTAISTPLTAVLAHKEVSKAKALVKKGKPKVIAITGSFGKSSSKDFLSTLLSNSFSIVKTQASENTPLGIARRINKNLKPGTDILILEMGAYKQGEIIALTDIAKPDIAWITALGPQHIGLFGSLENIKKTKYELVNSLPKEGVAVLPMGTDNEKDLVAWAQKDKISLITYTLKKNSATFTGSVSNSTDTSFTLTIKEKDNAWSVNVPLRGSHYAKSLLGAIAIARTIKVDRAKIIAAIAKLKQPPRQLELKKLPSGVTLIDNSFSTNSDGFSASVEYLKTFPGRHFVVTPGIIELGKYSPEIHRSLGKKLEPIDRIWVTNLKHGREMSSKENHVKGSENIPKLFAEISQTLKAGDTLLIEGRILESLKQKLFSL